MDRFVTDHLGGVSRTYAVLIPMLPRGLDEAVGLAYLLMRVVDTIEDAPQLSDDERLACFAALRAILPGAAPLNARAESADGGPDRGTAAALLRDVAERDLGDLTAEHALMRELPRLLERLGLLEPFYREAAAKCAVQMMDGVTSILHRSRERGLAYPGNRDAAELREYCHYVAGVVGEMLCDMMAHHLRSDALGKLRGVAVELGIGLQLVNILKDSLRDADGGRRYLPIASGRVSSGELYKLVLEEARASLKRGTEFVLALPAAAWELRSFCGLPIAWGAMTLARAERDAGAAKIGRGAVQASIDLFKRLVRDDHALRGWLMSMLRPTPA
ncbi:MAG: squalene/phytoene synthase family protein [Planctomycetia bacterium]|nr:MAG: squalene/phytoene synthase family protein [Planctomycetia bacterium]